MVNILSVKIRETIFIVYFHDVLTKIIIVNLLKDFNIINHNFNNYNTNQICLNVIY